MQQKQKHLDFSLKQIHDSGDIFPKDTCWECKKFQGTGVILGTEMKGFPQLDAQCHGAGLQAAFSGY